VNLVLRRVGLRSDASRGSTWLFIGIVCVLAVSATYAAINVWHVTNESMFWTLNTCVDREAGPLWQEQPYRPSPEYASCVEGVRHAAIIEASLVVGLLACAVAAVMSWVVQEFFNDYVVPLDGSQAYAFDFRSVRTVCAVAAVMFAAAAVMIIFPVS
jgi:hypothetical protein